MRVSSSFVHAMIEAPSIAGILLSLLDTIDPAFCFD
jgi:hypothetical protein